MNILNGFLGILPQLLMKGNTPAKALLKPMIAPLPQLLMHHDNPAPTPEQPAVAPTLDPNVPMTVPQRQLALRGAIVNSLLARPIVTGQPTAAPSALTGAI